MMAKVARKSNVKSSKINLKGKIVKEKSKKLKGLNKKNGLTNGKTNKSKQNKRSNNGKESSNKIADSSLEMKKKPSKLDLKLVIETLKKDADLLTVRKALKYVPFYLKSEGLAKKLLKEIIRLWSESTEKIRVVCLLCLIRIYSKLNDQEKRQMVIKNLYTTFLDKCGITKFETMSMIGFMRHSLIELYKIDPQIAFKQSQTACQQLSITLKNATTHKNEESYRSVLNWRYANCLILLSQLISSHTDVSQVRSLKQQVIQLNIGSINLLTSPRYYPYYCHLIENLIHLSIASNVYIPVLPLVLSILKRLSFPLEKKIKPNNLKPKNPNKSTSKDQLDDMFSDDGEDDTSSNSGQESEDQWDEEEEEEEEEEGEEEEQNEHDKREERKKEYNIDLLNHVSLDEAHSPNYQQAVLNKLYELMLLYLSSQCHRIAFPELVFLPLVHMKKWLKNNPGQPAQKFKVLLDKIKSDCERNEEARKSIDFVFTNYAAVDAWEKKLRDSNKLGLPKLYRSCNE